MEIHPIVTVPPVSLTHGPCEVIEDPKSVRPRAPSSRPFPVHYDSYSRIEVASNYSPFHFPSRLRKSYSVRDTEIASGSFSRQALEWALMSDAWGGDMAGSGTCGTSMACGRRLSGGCGSELWTANKQPMLNETVCPCRDTPLSRALSPGHDTRRRAGSPASRVCACGAAASKRYL